MSNTTTMSNESNFYVSIEADHSLLDCSGDHEIAQSQSPSHQHDSEDVKIERNGCTPDSDVSDFTVTYRKKEDNVQNNADNEDKLCGWISKLGNKGIVKLYRARWFVYGERTGKLYYYRSQNDLLPLGEIDIQNASFSYDIASSEKQGIFQIRCGERVYMLDAGSQRSYWLENLQAKRREYSEKKTSLTKILPQRNSCHGGLLAQDNPPNASDSNNEHAPVFSIDYVTSGSALPPQTAETPSVGRFTSLMHLGSEIRNALVNFKADKASPSTETNTILNGRQITPSDMSASSSQNSIGRPDQDGSMLPKMAGLNSKIQTLRRKFRKPSEELSDHSPVTGCSKCKQFEVDLSSSHEDVESLEGELIASREVAKLLQREVDKLSREKETRTRLHGSSDFDVLEELLSERDRKIVDLEYLVSQLQTEVRETMYKLRSLEDEHQTVKDHLCMYQEMVHAKDSIIMNLTDQLFAYEKGDTSLVTSRVQDTCMPFFVDATQVEELKDECEAYKQQHQFLCSEILELSHLRVLDEEREKSVRIQYAHMEAKYYQTQSKYLLLLNELKTPLRGGEENQTQEMITQLVAEALESEKHDKTRFISSGSSHYEYDRYGFQKSYRQYDSSDNDLLLTRATELQRKSEEINVQLKDVDETVSHQVKWENYMVSQENKEVRKSPELKLLIRGGIPNQYREQIWQRCIQFHVLRQREKLGPYHYRNLVAKSNDNKYNPASKQIELDLLRTLPNNRHYESLDSEGVRKLRRVLLAYSWHNPEIGYCQGLNRIAAIALLFLNEEDSFWCMVAIVEYIMPPHYYTSTLLAAQADQRVVKDLLQEKLPRLWAHLEEHAVDLSLFTFNWFLTIFVDNIPPDTFLRIWDTFLYEGCKVLFRYCLAIFKGSEDQILKETSAIAIHKFLRSIGEQVIDIRQLAQISFHELGSFPMRVIATRRQFHLLNVQNELDELDALRESFCHHPSENMFYSDDDV